MPGSVPSYATAKQTRNTILSKCKPSGLMYQTGKGIAHALFDCVVRGGEFGIELMRYIMKQHQIDRLVLTLGRKSIVPHPPRVAFTEVWYRNP